MIYYDIFLSIVDFIWGFSIWTYTKKRTFIHCTYCILFIGRSKIGNAWCIILGILTCTWRNEGKTVEENPGLKICINDYLGGHGGFEEWLKNYIGKQILAYHLSVSVHVCAIYICYKCTKSYYQLIVKITISEKRRMPRYENRKFILKVFTLCHGAETKVVIVQWCKQTNIRSPGPIKNPAWRNFWINEMCNDCPLSLAIKHKPNFYFATTLAKVCINKILLRDTID